MLKVCRFKEIKTLSFVSKGKFLKGDGIKSNNGNMMRSNDGTPYHHGSKNEGTCFFG